MPSPKTGDLFTGSNLDLFGDPVAPPHPRRGRGRPRHAPTKGTRRIATMMHRAGAPQWRIAERLGITEPTLRLHYPQVRGR